jgi:hypothetical protein
VIYYHFFPSLSHSPYACNDSAKRSVLCFWFCCCRFVLWPEITAEERQSARREEAVGLGSERLCCPCFEVEGLRQRGRSREQISSAIHAADSTAEQETRQSIIKATRLLVDGAEVSLEIRVARKTFFKMFLRLTVARISSPHHTLILRSCNLLRSRHSGLKKGLSARCN